MNVKTERWQAVADNAELVRLTGRLRFGRWYRTWRRGVSTQGPGR